MQDVLVVIDMQNDFIDGALGTTEAVAIVPRVREKIQGFSGPVLFTRDTHHSDYLKTQEGLRLPVAHCIEDTEGWQIRAELDALRVLPAVDKPSFGSVALPELLMRMDREEPLASVTLIGLCTDICVISNAMIIKAFMPELPIRVDAACCAGVSPQTHRNALEAMKVCQIEIVNE